MLQIATKKVVRLPGGKYITRRLVESTPETLAGAKPDEIWMTADERLIVVGDMDLRHLMNAIKILEGRAVAVMKEFGIQGDLHKFAGQLDRRYLTMTDELSRRAGAGEATDEIQESTPRKFTA